MNLFFIIQLKTCINFVFKLYKKSPDAPLTEEIMAGSLLLLCKTGNGLSHAYVRLDAAQK